METEDAGREVMQTFKMRKALVILEHELKWLQLKLLAIYSPWPLSCMYEGQAGMVRAQRDIIVQTADGDAERRGKNGVSHKGKEGKIGDQI